MSFPCHPTQLYLLKSNIFHFLIMFLYCIVPYLRHKSILVSLMDAILRKVQMHHNLEELQEIDNEAIDDDVSIIWLSGSVYLSCCLE